MNHKPVLLAEVLEAFEGVKLHTFFDGTLGAAGHAKALLEAHPEMKCYIGCDRDPRAHELSKERLEPWKDKLKLMRSSYKEALEQMNEPLDGILIDAGVSSMQLDEKQRGFSFMEDAPLDMRMDPEQTLTAKEVVNRYSEKELSTILFEYGEERRARKIAKAICIARKKKPIETTLELVKIIRPIARGGKKHPATLTFQALRIEVNQELKQLQEGITRGLDLLAPSGVMAVISFHSLEDRIVKNSFKEVRKDFSFVSKKPIVPSRQEMRENPRSRSAKLRIAKR